MRTEEDVDYSSVSSSGGTKNRHGNGKKGSSAHALSLKSSP